MRIWLSVLSAILALTVFGGSRASASPDDCVDRALDDYKKQAAAFEKTREALCSNPCFLQATAPSDTLEAEGLDSLPCQRAGTDDYLLQLEALVRSAHGTHALSPLLSGKGTSQDKTKVDADSVTLCVEADNFKETGSDLRGLAKYLWHERRTAMLEKLYPDVDEDNTLEASIAPGCNCKLGSSVTINRRIVPACNDVDREAFSNLVNQMDDAIFLRGHAFMGKKSDVSSGGRSCLQREANLLQTNYDPSFKGDFCDNESDNKVEDSPIHEKSHGEKSSGKNSFKMPPDAKGPKIKAKFTEPKLPKLLIEKPKKPKKKKETETKEPKTSKDSKGSKESSDDPLKPAAPTVVPTVLRPPVIQPTIVRPFNVTPVLRPPSPLIH